MLAMRLMKMSVLANIIREENTSACESGMKLDGIDVAKEIFNFFGVMV